MSKDRKKLIDTLTSSLPDEPQQKSPSTELFESLTDSMVNLLGLQDGSEVTYWKKTGTDYVVTTYTESTGTTQHWVIADVHVNAVRTSPSQDQ